MKTYLPTFLGFLILICSCTINQDKNYKNFILIGEMIGQDSGIIILRYVLDTNLISDTSIIINSKFVFTGRIFEPTRASINGKNDLSRVEIYLEPRKMKVSLPKGNFIECKMTGSKTQNELELLRKMDSPINERLSILRKQLFNINDSIKNLKTGPGKVLLEKKAKEIDKQYSQVQEELDSIRLKFVLENPKSFVSPVYLHMLETNQVISLDSLKYIFNGLDNSIQKSKYGKYIIEDIRKKEKIRLGAQAPDFKAIGLNQQTVTLSQFIGKSVVLLDFWASWCVPCRQSIPHLKTIYNKYHSKGFEVIAISKDENRKAWIEAVNKDSTEMWYHILVAKKNEVGPSQSTENDIDQKYLVETIPVQILIDKNGQIIGRLRGATKENEESLDKLLSQIFDK